MAVMSVSLFMILGIATTVYGRPRFGDEQQMIDDFFPALLDRLQNNPEYAYLLERGDFFSNRRQQLSPVQQQVNWPTSNLNLGQVAGVAVDKNGDVLVFHRDNRQWGGNTFDFNNQLTQGEKDKGPIKNPTILKLDKNGTVTQSLGENKFFMPHGLTVDKDGNLWVTDVGLHQVIKIPAGSNKGLVLGKKMEPGSGIDHFCKPTDVAVASNGDFFVSDGYCNSRVMKFSDDGTFITQWGRTPKWGRAEGPGPDELYIPHSLALIEEADLICVADREHGRVQCFKAGLKDRKDTGKFVRSIKDLRFGRVFAISYDPIDKKMYLVNGETGGNQVNGFTIDLRNNDLQDPTWGKVQEPAWGPKNFNFDEPHDIAVSPDGKNVYVAEIRPDRLTKFNK